MSLVAYKGAEKGFLERERESVPRFAAQGCTGRSGVEGNETRRPRASALRPMNEGWSLEEVKEDGKVA